MQKLMNGFTLLYMTVGTGRVHDLPQNLVMGCFLRRTQFAS
jgi:hypothetical protein